MIRCAGSFALEDFDRAVGKVVRKDHVSTDNHWNEGKIERNEKNNDPASKPFIADILRKAAREPLKCEICGEKKILRKEEAPRLVGPPINRGREVHRVCHECYRCLLGQSEGSRELKE